MVTVYPEGVQAEGNDAVWFVPAIANLTAPTVTEINAGINLSCYIKGTFDINNEQGTGDDRRLCSKQTFQTLGRVTTSVQPITYVYDPQAPTGDAENEAYETLTQGTKGYLVRRRGLDAQDVDIAAAQKVTVVPIECGVQDEDPIPDNDEFAKLTVTQVFGVTGPVKKGAVAAGA